MTQMHRRMARACTALLIACAAPAWSQTSEEPAAKPLWEAGVFGFGVSQTAYPGADERVNRGFGLPFVIYRGKFFRVDENTVGVRAVSARTRASFCSGL